MRTIIATTTATVVDGFRASGHLRPGVGPDPSAPSTSRASGNYLMLVDASGRHHYYNHMERPSSRRPGDTVPGGTQIGTVGASGLSAGFVQHLHYQVSERNSAGAVRVFLNPYQELVRLVADQRYGRGGVTERYGFYTVHPPGDVVTTR